MHVHSSGRAGGGGRPRSVCPAPLLARRSSTTAPSLAAAAASLSWSTSSSAAGPTSSSWARRWRACTRRSPATRARAAASLAFAWTTRSEVGGRAGGSGRALPGPAAEPGRSARAAADAASTAGTPQPNEWSDNWVEFYREQRLRHMLQQANNASLTRLAQPVLDHMEVRRRGGTPAAGRRRGGGAATQRRKWGARVDGRSWCHRSYRLSPWAGGGCRPFSRAWRCGPRCCMATYGPVT